MGWSWLEYEREVTCRHCGESRGTQPRKPRPRPGCVAWWQCQLCGYEFAMVEEPSRKITVAITKVIAYAVIVFALAVVPYTVASVALTSDPTRIDWLFVGKHDSGR